MDQKFQTIKKLLINIKNDICTPYEFKQVLEFDLNRSGWDEINGVLSAMNTILDIPSYVDRGVSEFQQLRPDFVMLCRMANTRVNGILGYYDEDYILA